MNCLRSVSMEEHLEEGIMWLIQNGDRVGTIFQIQQSRDSLGKRLVHVSPMFCFTRELSD